MKPTRLAVRGVLLKDNLLGIMYVQKHNCYLFPGGEVEPGESLEAGVIRELEEESGYVTEVIEHLTQVIYEEPELIHHNEIFVCRVVGHGTLHKTQLEEDWGINFEWMNPVELASFCEKTTTEHPSSIIHRSLCLVVNEVLKALYEKGYLNGSH
jgi:ADP-ribose pyrophosphatase YjhB (NUDIX family)